MCNSRGENPEAQIETTEGTPLDIDIKGEEVALWVIALIVIGLCVFVVVVFLITVFVFRWRKLCCFKPQIIRTDINPVYGVTDDYYYSGARFTTGVVDKNVDEYNMGYDRFSTKAVDQNQYYKS